MLDDRAVVHGSHGAELVDQDLAAIQAVAALLEDDGARRAELHGLDGEEIIVYKFRSMRAQDDGQVVKQATKGDSRITRFGAFIRRTSLDELPQFINVLQGG